MPQLHFLGVHHVIAIPEELCRFRKLPDMSVKPVQDRWHLGEDEGLCVSQNRDRRLIDHVEPKPFQDRAFSSHLHAPRCIELRWLDSRKRCLRKG